MPDARGRAKIAALRADAATQAKLDDYAEKNHEGTISPYELSEHKALVSALNLIAILQAQARAVLAADRPFVVEMSGTEPVASPRSRHPGFAPRAIPGDPFGVQ